MTQPRITIKIKSKKKALAQIEKQILKLNKKQERAYKRWDFEKTKIISAQMQLAFNIRDALLVL